MSSLTLRFRIGDVAYDQRMNKYIVTGVFSEKEEVIYELQTPTKQKILAEDSLLYQSGEITNYQRNELLELRQEAIDALENL